MRLAAPLAMTLALAACGDESDVGVDASADAPADAGPAASPTLIAFAPPVLAFDTVEAGQRQVLAVTLQNRGDVDARLGPITLAGEPFHQVSSTCESKLRAKNFCTITLAAAPVTIGIAAGSLAVSSGGATAVATLQVVGVHRVTVASSGTGSGILVSEPVGIACSDCSAFFRAPVTLTARAAAGATFVEWSLPACGTAPTCTIPATAAAVTVSAAFASR